MIIKKVWNYCSYNKLYLLFIFLLLLIPAMFQNYVSSFFDDYALSFIYALALIIIAGYGMEITQDRINGGKRLPKLRFWPILSLGVKSVIVITIFIWAQEFFLEHLFDPWSFPVFDLEDLLLDLPNTIYMLYTHDSFQSLVYVVVGTMVFYITTFFIEIALARLADTNSIVQAFNFVEITRDIDLFGWRNYALHYTTIVFAIVFLTLISSYHFFIYPILESVTDTFLLFLIFVTQYFGIGAIYCEIKKLKNKND